MVMAISFASRRADATMAGPCRAGKLDLASGHRLVLGCAVGKALELEGHVMRGFDFGKVSCGLGYIDRLRRGLNANVHDLLGK